MLRLAGLCSLLLVATLGIAPDVRAQEARLRLAGPEDAPTEEEVAEARGLFASASDDADNGQWADALEGFRQSYRLSGHPASLFNAAMTLRSIGRFRDARDVFDQVLEEHADAGDAVLEQARAYRTEVAARVARLTLLELPEVPELELRLDGELTSDGGGRPLRLDVDPGPHALRVTLSGREPFRWEGSVDDGSDTNISVELPEASSGGVARKWWFWTIIGVVVVGGAVTAGVLLSHEQLEPNGVLVLNI